MLINNKRWADEVMGQRMIFTCGVMTLLPFPRVIVSNFPDEKEIDIDFDKETVDEILKCAYSYNEKIILMEINGCMWGFAPSLFPSSSMLIVMKFHLAPKLVLALIKECGAQDIFELSQKIKAHPSRDGKRVSEYRDIFCGFCELCSNIFGNMRRLSMCFGNDEIKDEIVLQCLYIARFVGTPITVDVEFECEKVDSYDNTDLALFTAFVFSMLCFARVNDKNRSASIDIKLFRWSPAVTVRVVPEEAIDIRSYINSGMFNEWERIIFEKRMPFGVCCETDTIKIGFQPYVIELSYMDIKNLTFWEEEYHSDGSCFEK